MPHDATIPHSPAEDILGVLTGTFLASLGIYLLEQAEAVTGGTAGLALLLTFGTDMPFAVLFALVNIPFFALAVWKRGWIFTGKTAVCVGLVSGFSLAHQSLLPQPDINPIYGVFAGNVLVGVGLLIIFRHRSSLGGFTTLALIAQDRWGLRAGYVQMGLDVAVILAGLVVVAWPNVLLSAAGAVLLNIILAFNHRPGRYRG